MKKSESAEIAQQNEIEQYNKKSFKSIQENFNRNKMKVCMTIGMLPNGDLLSLANSGYDKKILGTKLMAMANQLITLARSEKLDNKEQKRFKIIPKK